MKRLIEDAAKLDESIDKNDMSFGNIVKSINAVQKEMGIYGTTAKEAEKTITGSLNAMKGAWYNLLTGVADDTADFDKLINDLVGSVETFGENILPRISVALDGAVKLVGELFPKIVEKLPDLINENLSGIVSGAIQIVEAVISAIVENKDSLSDSLVSAISKLLSHAAQNTPKLIGGLLDFIIALIKEIGENLDQILPEIILSIVKLITEIANRAPDFTEAIFAVIDGIVNVLTSPEGIAKMIEAGANLLISLLSGMLSSTAQLIEGVGTIITNIVQEWKTANWEDIGQNVVDGIWQGLKNAWGSVVGWFKNAWLGLVVEANETLGIHSPSRVFAEIGKNMALGVGIGWDDAFGDVDGDIANSLDFGDIEYGIETSTMSIDDLNNGLFSGNGVSIVQNIYSEAKTAADLMLEATLKAEEAVIYGV